MSEQGVPSDESVEASAHVATGTPVNCPSRYELQGPQIEPEASCWLQLAPRVPCMFSEGELRGQVEKVIDRANAHDGLQPWTGLLSDKPCYPTDPATLKEELEELIQLARLRDEPNRISNTPPIDCPPELAPQGARLPLSVFLKFRPQPLGAVINSARDQSTFPVVNTGRELARYFENETPGIQFRHALNGIIRDSNFSAPRQAFIWAALDMAIAGGLAAAWYYKWRGGNCIEYRPRPWECLHELDVLYDRVPNSTNSADSARRAYPPGVPFDAPQPNELVLPEANVTDVIATNPTGSFPTPGTPRHPAYPSGHSTYSAAAAFTLIAFFPQYAEDLLRLADNTGVARLWAGVHWRTDHIFGQLVGRAVAELIVKQLIDAGIFEEDPTVMGKVAYLPPDLGYLRPRLFVRSPSCDTSDPSKSPYSAPNASPPTPDQINNLC